MTPFHFWVAKTISELGGSGAAYLLSLTSSPGKCSLTYSEMACLVVNQGKPLEKPLEKQLIWMGEENETQALERDSAIVTTNLDDPGWVH